MEKRRGVIARAVKLPQAGQPGQLPVRLVTGGSGGASEQSTLESAGREQEKHQQYLSWRRRDLGDRSQRRVRAQSAQERGEPQPHHLAPCDSEPPLDLPDTPASAPEPAMSLQRRVMTPERQLSKSLRRSQSLNLRAALAGSGKLRLGASLEPAERADSRGSRPGSKASTVPSVMGSSGGALQLATAAATPAPEEVSEVLRACALRLGVPLALGGSMGPWTSAMELVLLAHLPVAMLRMYARGDDVDEPRCPTALQELGGLDLRPVPKYATEDNP
ncbi:unnamed protein product [Prorocentrum cordatum]|uniref:Uncharacterized protein n=1 Tax=Prorocentrum cordatum TaxID=2364126 RepID=A0ABN9VC61_9DINO|nr:unnamed protein product [Polarella glacialis]